MPTYLALFPEISLANDSKTKICKSIQTSATFATNPVKCLGLLREGCKKSKWKFKMAFAMKGGGGLEGVSFAIKLF